ncbi:hypothetical protein OCU04_002381 [Sclerotinia nivalis]|uniref:Uncharacterized protein n=1 Tax=Sclerotinia nivalis TaxID=352851 RepID=A0A9X0ATI0_9HELO|nr:hypothetical protein OCU04_002381 [Sclerotinia nivalis]
MVNYFEEVRHKAEKEREIRERLAQRREQEWRYNTQRRRQDWDSIRLQISPNCEKYQHYKESQIQRQVEIDYLAEQARELYALQQDPEYQAEQREMRRFQESRRSALKRKLVRFFNGDENLERLRERAKEEEAAKWQAEIQLCIAEFDRRNRVEIKWTYLVIWGLSILSVGLAVFACVF